MENIKIFEKHFVRGMASNDFEAFKRTYPTLLKCILGAMDEVSPKDDGIRPIRSTQTRIIGGTNIYDRDGNEMQ